MGLDIRRGDIWWATLPRPTGSGPGFRRPVLEIQGDAFNMSRLGTIMVAAITSNTQLARAPGNVKMDMTQSQLPRESVINVSQVATLERRIFTEYVTSLSEELLERVNTGLRLVLNL